MRYRKEKSQDNVVKLHLVTADDRLADLIRFVYKENPNRENTGAPDDIISTQMNGGSQEYVSWVKEQTRSPEEDKPEEKEKPKEDEEDQKEETKEDPQDDNDTQSNSDIHLKKKKKTHHKKKKSSKAHPTAKSQEFNKTFHLAEVDDNPIEETDNMEYFE
jgi:hypothetical protein